jgi:hypothetical protein
VLVFVQMARKKSAEEITLADHLRSISERGGKARSKTMTKEERSSLARSGGLVGGKARAATLSKKRRQEIAKRAAAVRWAKKKQS